MKDWKAIARGGGLDIPSPDMERMIGALDALEEAFRPLVKDLMPETEPATALRFGEDEE